MSQLEPKPNPDDRKPLEDLYALLGDFVTAETKNASPSDPTADRNSETSLELTEAKSLESIDLSADTAEIDTEIVNTEITEVAKIRPAISETDNLAQPSNGSEAKTSEPTAGLLPDDLAPVATNKITSPDISQQYVSQQWLIEKEQRVAQLADNINTLLPLVTQLAQAETANTEEYILQAIVPVIDRVIKQRAAQDNSLMAEAIANLLPDAIQQEINNVPQSIGKAIAPELALSITEQIKLDQNAIAEALGSEMGKAIKTQIEVERDAMVDALYPVIGSTISKYMAEVVESINQRVDNALSPEGIKRKIRAKMQGITEAELILKESFPYRIRAAFLIQKASGLVIAEAQSDLAQSLESDLLAGMLTAIRSFANDCITEGSELDEISYESFDILFETAGYCYLAVVVDGEPDGILREQMRQVFGKIITRYHEEIAAYQGDTETIPAHVQSLLAGLTYQEVTKETKGSSKSLYWLIIGVLSSLLIPLGIVVYRARTAHSIERSAQTILERTPELAIYNLHPEVKRGELTLRGKVPSAYLRDLSVAKIQPLATVQALQLNNQVVAVNVPVDPTITQGEVARTTKVLNQTLSSAIATSYQDQTVTVESFELKEQEKQNLLTTFRNIPGVNSVMLLANQKLPTIDSAIYFDSGVTTLANAEAQAEIVRIESFLKEFSAIGLIIVGYSDRQGDPQNNLRLANARSQSVYQQLVAKGIASNRLQIRAASEPPPDTTAQQPAWQSRVVRFESFLLSD